MWTCGSFTIPLTPYCDLIQEIFETILDCDHVGMYGPITKPLNFPSDLI